MKKKQYVIAISCLVAGLIGFGSVYATERAAEKRQQEQIAKQEEVTEKEEKSESVSGVIPPKKTTPSIRVTVEDQREPQVEIKTKVEEEDISPDLETIDNYVEEAEEPIEQAQPKVSFQDTLHFAEEDQLVWPLEGNVLLNYSMDSTIYFPTLDQYKYNPAVIIGGDVNSKVYLVAKGVITDITNNEVTGCTVTEDLGDGYSAVYGQLKELNFAVGDQVEGGQVIGYVSEPTKYYSLEGSNLYFELLKDGEPVNPLDYFE